MYNKIFLLLSLVESAETVVDSGKGVVVSCAGVAVDIIVLVCRSVTASLDGVDVVPQAVTVTKTAT